MHTQGFTLAGLDFLLWAQNAAPPPFPESYTPFLSASAEAPQGGRYESIGSPDDRLLPVREDEALWSGPAWRLGRTPAGRIGLDLHHVPLSRWIPVAGLSEDFASGILSTATRTPGRYSTWAMNYPCDQVVLINRLALLGVAAFHAGAVAWEDGAWLFCGPSGAGKTTLCRLAAEAGAEILSDEKPLVRMTPEGLFASGSPWHGEESARSARLAPLRGVFFLQQASENRVNPLSPGLVVTRLASGAVAPVYRRPAVSLLLEVWSRIAETVPVGVLEFTPDGRAFDACRRAVGR